MIARFQNQITVFNQIECCIFEYRNNFALKPEWLEGEYYSQKLARSEQFKDLTQRLSDAALQQQSCPVLPATQ